MRKLFWMVGAAVLLAAEISSPAQAAIISRTYDFTASRFVNLDDPSMIAPIDPVTGSFTLTFDDAVTVKDQTIGLKVNFFSMPMGSSIGYDYLESWDSVSFGGLEQGVGTIATGNFDHSTDDFYLGISSIRAAPKISAFRYTREGVYAFFTAQSLFMEVSSVPEPQTWALMLAGFGLMGASLRRRRWIGVTA